MTNLIVDFRHVPKNLIVSFFQNSGSGSLSIVPPP